MSLQCPVCKGEAREGDNDNQGDRRWIACQRCGGTFPIGGSYCHSRQCQSDPLPLLSGMLRRAFEQGKIPAILTEPNAGDLMARAPASAPEKAMELLTAISRKAPRPGEDEVVLTHEIDYPLAYASSGKELRSYLADISKHSWIEIRRTDESSTCCTLTVSGLTAIEQRTTAGQTD
jgi:hypothetical protein